MTILLGIPSPQGEGESVLRCRIHQHLPYRSPVHHLRGLAVEQEREVRREG